MAISSGSKILASDVTGHINNKSNPHGVTAAQVGAAASSHNHAASNITSGTLPVARGGTGVTSLDALATALAGAGSTRIVTGSYVGTGSYASTTPISITLGFIPKLLIVYEEGNMGCLTGYYASSSDHGMSRSIIAAYPTTEYNQVGESSGYYGQCRLHITWGTTVSWYLDGTRSRAEAACNVSGKTYRYLAFY